MPRFVILTHDHPFRHWDLMLEAGGVLRTWRLRKRPQTGLTVAAEPLGDHRLAYLDYEGPVSGGRGTVTRWDAGDYELVRERDGNLTLRFSGRQTVGVAELIRTESGTWTFLLQEPRVPEQS